MRNSFLERMFRKNLPKKKKSNNENVSPVLKAGKNNKEMINYRPNSLLSIHQSYGNEFCCGDWTISSSTKAILNYWKPMHYEGKSICHMIEFRRQIDLECSWNELILLIVMYLISAICYGGMESWFPIGVVVDGSHVAIGFDQWILSANDISITFFLLMFDVTGVRVVYAIFEGVSWMIILKRVEFPGLIRSLITFGQYILRSIHRDGQRLTWGDQLRLSWWGQLEQKQL